MEYFKVIVRDKQADVRKWAVYNLPCFYLKFRNNQNASYFDQTVLELCKMEQT